MCELYFEWTVSFAFGLSVVAVLLGISITAFLPGMFNNYFWLKSSILLFSLVFLSQEADTFIYRSCLAGESPGPGDGMKLYFLVPLLLFLVFCSFVALWFIRRASKSRLAML